MRRTKRGVSISITIWYRKYRWLRHEGCTGCLVPVLDGRISSHFLLSDSSFGKNIDWRQIMQLDNLQVPTVSHINYYKLLFHNLSSSDK